MGRDLPQRALLGRGQHEVVPAGARLDPHREPVQGAAGVRAALAAGRAAEPERFPVELLGTAAGARLDGHRCLHGREEGGQASGERVGVTDADQQGGAVQGSLA